MLFWSNSDERSHLATEEEHERNHLDEAEWHPIDLLFKNNMKNKNKNLARNALDSLLSRYSPAARKQAQFRAFGGGYSKCSLAPTQFDAEVTCIVAMGETGSFVNEGETALKFFKPKSPVSQTIGLGVPVVAKKGSFCYRLHSGVSRAVLVRVPCYADCENDKSKLPKVLEES